MVGHDPNCECSDCIETRSVRNSRLIRIEKEIAKNRMADKSELEQSRGYCEALVDGQIAIEEKMIKLMTREEAISKCHGISYPEVFIQALEALGLITFKEKEPEGLPIGFQFPFSKRAEWAECVYSLRRQGWMITKL